MDSKAIEMLAVNAVEKSMALCDYLSPFISDNDKEPSWDGSIFIYNNLIKKKSEIKGRVPVQVKGKLESNFNRTEITYSVEVAHLNNYLNEGGTIFFVVYINQKTNEEKIYYSTLSPVKLKRYLSGIKNQKRKSIGLKEFPCENLKKSDILLNFYENCVRQKSFAKTTPLLIEDLQKGDSFTKWTIPFSGFGEIKDPIKTLFENEVYLYAEIKGSNILHPVDIIPFSIEVSVVVEKDIIVDGIKFYDKFTRTRTTGRQTITIGNSFSIQINEKDNSSKIQYSHSSMLRQRVKDLDFNLRVIKAKEFYIGGKKIPILIPDKELENFDLIAQEENLKYYKKMVKVLDVLNVSEDLNLEEMKDNDIRVFEYLIKAFVDKKPVSNLNKGLPDIFIVKIANIDLLLNFIKSDIDDCTYIISDFFHSELVFNYKYNDSIHLRTSCFSALTQENYEKTSNIVYTEILPSFQKLLNLNDRIFEPANINLLKMLLAYDQRDNKNEKLFNAAKDLAEWIMNKDKNILPYELKLLNYLQVICRERDLNKVEIEQLIGITEGHSLQEDFKVGAYLLLGNQMAAEIHFEKMDKEHKKIIKESPIYYFWNKKK